MTSTNYPPKLYTRELECHERAVQEYLIDICQDLSKFARANTLELSLQYDYKAIVTRTQLLDFLLKVANSLRLLPFVYFRGIKLFDKYCNIRAIRGQETQTIIMACLIIAAKFYGGHRHPITSDRAHEKSFVGTTSNLTLITGSHPYGPTLGYRKPRLSEFFRYAGQGSTFTAKYFILVEMNILQTLNWSLCSPSIEDFIVTSNEFYILQRNELLQVKLFLSYCSLYSYDLMNVSILELSEVIIDVINEAFNVNEHVNYCGMQNKLSNTYTYIKQRLISSIINASDLMLHSFNTRGPRILYQKLVRLYSRTPGMSTRQNSSSARFSLYLDSGLGCVNL